MSAATATASADADAARDQFAGRSRDELVTMCQLRELQVRDSDTAPKLRRRLRDDVAARRLDDPGARIVMPSADRDTAARMALIDREVSDHFADRPDPITTGAIAHALRRNQQEVLLSLQRLGCPRLSDGRYGPPPTTTTLTEAHR